MIAQSKTGKEKRGRLDADGRRPDPCGLARRKVWLEHLIRGI
jgi:hypothetical protein